MKKSLLLPVLAINVCAVSSLSAQESKSPWSFGVKSGINLSNTTKDGYDPKVGFNIGGTVEYDLGKNLFLGSGLEFTTKGAKSDAYYIDYPVFFDFDGGEHKYTGQIKSSQSIMYLQLPLTLGYRLPISEKFNLTFRAGAYLAYGIAMKGSNKHNGMEVDPNGTKTAINLKNNYSDFGGIERFDYGLVGGVGAEFGKFSVNMNYEYGLRNIMSIRNPYFNIQRDYTQVKPYNAPKWKNLNASLSVGYKF